MERCIASGLWIADASTVKDNEGKDDDEGEAGAAKGDGKEAESKDKPECSSAGKSGEGSSCTKSGKN